jgi:hypothetical protein
MEKIQDKPNISETISALLKSRKDDPKDGIDLLSITKKLSSKRFGKGKR